VSVQNEPDYTASYDSMLVSDSEFADFVNVLGPKLAALSPRPRLIVGDYSNWNLLWSMVGGIEANPSALSRVDVYAAHQYWGVSAYHPGRPRPLWQTEMSSFDAFDPGIGNGVTVAKWIHSAITDGNVTAWHYWWLYNPYNPTNEGLVGYPGDRNAPTKRLYTLGNFSRFVRPGWQRIDVGNGFGANLFVSAYRNAPTGDFAIVVVNDSGGNLPLTTALAGLQTATVTPWVTSATLDLQAQAPVSVIAGQLSAGVAYGVTTFRIRVKSPRWACGCRSALRKKMVMRRARLGRAVSHPRPSFVSRRMRRIEGVMGRTPLPLAFVTVRNRNASTGVFSPSECSTGRLAALIDARANAIFVDTRNRLDC
jgi:glucuronoarabinoxylan endo-1,4-beta-xylanase